MQVRIKKTHPQAVVPFKTYDEDFCYDVVAVSCDEMAPNVYRYGLGLAFEIVECTDFPKIAVQKEWGVIYKKPIFSIDFRPRSSVWKTGMVLSNCTGTIDQLYRGEVSAVFYHVHPDMPRYEVGDKIGQIKLGLTLPMEFEEATELTSTERGENGYGSTGK